MTDQDAEFERTGEQAVRDNLAQGLYKEPRAARARAWLENLERGRNRAFAAEQMRISRASRNAAIAATAVSIIAAIIAYFACKPAKLTSLLVTVRGLNLRGPRL